jgi:hypothetical protein
VSGRRAPLEEGGQVNTSDMPTAEDLRAVARAAFEQLRGARKQGPRSPMSELAFAHSELKAMGMVEVYDAEFRRHELLMRGFTPPAEFEAHKSCNCSSPRGV